MGGTRISDDEKSDIIYFHRIGASDKFIANSMDIKMSRVKYVIKRYYIPRPWYCQVLNWLGFDYVK